MAKFDFNGAVSVILIQGGTDNISEKTTIHHKYLLTKIHFSSFHIQDIPPPLKKTTQKFHPSGMSHDRVSSGIVIVFILGLERTVFGDLSYLPSPAPNTTHTHYTMWNSKWITSVNPPIQTGEEWEAQDSHWSVKILKFVWSGRHWLGLLTWGEECTLISFAPSKWFPLSTTPQGSWFHPQRVPPFASSSSATFKEETGNHSLPACWAASSTYHLSLEWWGPKVYFKSQEVTVFGFLVNNFLAI